MASILGLCPLLKNHQLCWWVPIALHDLRRSHWGRQSKRSLQINKNPLSSQQTVNLVLDTIRQAVHREKKKVAAELHLHSDQGFQYTSQAYFKLTKQYGITPSMSRRGNPYDNAMAENFFSILKTECIYRHKPATFSEADEMIDRYILFYNHERIQSKTGVPPLSLRHSC